MRFVAALLLALGAVSAWAGRILLIPLDSRPAAGQFAQMIARMANVEVRMPPYEELGRFTSPGKPAEILAWLAKQDLGDVDAVVASADMIAYGGLVESRVNRVTSDLALSRIRELVRIVRARRAVKLYVFSSTMRLAPTATRATSRYGLALAKYEEAKARFAGGEDLAAGALVRRLAAKLPAPEIAAYDATRKRNHLVQTQLIRMQRSRMFDFLVIGQDDARPFGPHVAETAALKKLASDLKLADAVYFTEGVDQNASVLVSRALLDRAGWRPRLRVVYSDEEGKRKYASFETKPIEDSLADQIQASGARVAESGGEYDYSLYVNTPDRRPDRFRTFLGQLQSDVDQGFPTAVADINLAADGTADPELYAGVVENARVMRLLAYAGWNTAGNTMGTAIPAANVYLLARRLRVDPLARELAQREFLLHRFANDFAYHKFTRPEAYRMIRQSGAGSVEEVYGASYAAVSEFVRRDLTTHLDQIFREQFRGRRFFAGTREYVLNGVTDVAVFLPWPRAYEVRLEFRLQAAPVEASLGMSNLAIALTGLGVGVPLGCALAIALSPVGSGAPALRTAASAQASR